MFNVDFDVCYKELKNVKNMWEMSEKEKKMLYNDFVSK